MVFQSLDFLVWLAGVFSLASLAAGKLLLWKIPALGSAPLKTEAMGVISVVIPARNEERNLPRLLASLQAQTVLPLEVIVVDDQSQDRTADLAKAAGAKVIAALPLPAGWLGKPWACAQGAAAARGNWLLFLDADTWLEPRALAALGPYCEQERRVLSIQPHHRMAKPYEHLSLFFHCMQAAGTAAFTWQGRRRKPHGLFGPCLLIARSAYQAVGGHAAVRDRVLEHYSLASHLERADLQAELLPGGGLIAVRMYPEGLGSLIRGWAKSLARGAGQTPPGILLQTIIWLTGLVVITFTLLAGLLFRAEWLYSALPVYAIAWLQLTRIARRLGDFTWWESALYPVHLFFFFGVFGWALLLGAQKKTEWKGRRLDHAE
jgi:4,4'-diaponeurosporenoate glycosyltransferase